MENKIEVVRMNRLNGEGPLRAFCDISLFDALVIRGLRVVNGKKGLFVGMPQELGKDGKWYSIICPLNRDFKEVVQNTVLEAYAA